ncbi:MAG: acetate/propionate family kinase [Dinoroseobacter sp.]|nr:acetate/propionate family kinase [Dinoroseobacter sp.]
MKKALLTLNAGSSSLKFALFDADFGNNVLASGQVDRIGPEGVLRLKRADGAVAALPPGSLRTHEEALQTVIGVLRSEFEGLEVVAVGHRVVHGGTKYEAPVRLEPETVTSLEAFSPFAPLHQPHNLAGVRAAFAAFPGAPQVACFDTAFHRQHPFVNDTFALPREYFRKGVRRYGFHGLSYEFIAGELQRIDPVLASGRVVVAHLGNGASMCALQGGRSIASTMGFSALDGLPMGTRCGQLDPGVMLYLMTEEGLDAQAISDLLYKKSGLLGLSGVSNDMRTLEASQSPHAREAIDYYTFRIRRELGAMVAALEGLDGLVFCGGVGENSARIRAEVCDAMAWFGISLASKANDQNAQVISDASSRVRVMVIPTNEELVIARATTSIIFGDERAPA